MKWPVKLSPNKALLFWYIRSLRSYCSTDVMHTQREILALMWNQHTAENCVSSQSHFLILSPERKHKLLVTTVRHNIRPLLRHVAVCSGALPDRDCLVFSSTESDGRRGEAAGVFCCLSVCTRGADRLTPTDFADVQQPHRFHTLCQLCMMQGFLYRASTPPTLISATETTVIRCRLKEKRDS